MPVPTTCPSPSAAVVAATHRLALPPGCANPAARVDSGGIASWSASHLFSAVYLAAFAVVIVIGSVYLLRRRSSAWSLVSIIWTDYRSTILCFVALTGIAIALGIIASALGDGGAFWVTAVANVFASLVENLLFFSLLGFALLIVQRREADRNRNLDDKIDMLFSAKKLRSGEVAFLRNEVRKISADCRGLFVEIDVVEHDVEAGLVQIDVSRRWTVANYLSSASAQYSWQLGLTSEEIEGHDPAMFVFPSYSTAMSRDADGEWQRAADDEPLHPGGDVASGQRLESERQLLDIEPGQGREFRTRMTGWQPAFLGDAAMVAAGDDDPRVYRLKMDRHWDEVDISVRNSLKVPIRTTISGIGARTLELDPGDRKARAFKGENLPANSRVYVMFKVV